MTTLLLRSALRPLALLKPTLQRHSAVQLQSHFNIRQALHTSAVRLNLESAETQSHPLVATVKGVSTDPAQRPVQIYIGNLGPEIDSERLKLELVHYQGVGEVNVVVNPETGVSRGFAFVDFASIEAAQFVIDDAHGRELNGQALVVAPSKQSMPTRAEEKLSARALPARRLHIVNLPRELSELAIREVFTQHGGEIERVQRLLARKTQLPNGVAFITFKTQESATYALEALHNTQIGDRVVQVNYAQSINGKPVTAARVKLEREREEAKARPRGADAEDGPGFIRRGASRRSEGGERSEYASRERSDYGNGERRSSFSDRAPRDNYSDRESRSNYGDRSSARESRSFGGEREQRNSYERESRPTRAPREREEFAQRRSGGRDDFDAFEEPRPTRQSSFGERAPREFEERGARSFGGREARSYGGERESRSFGGDRESRSYGGGGRESRSYGDREESNFGGRPRSSSSGGYGGGERSSYGASRNGERSSFGGSRGGDRGGYGGGAGRSSGGERSSFGRGGARGGRGGFGRDRGSSGGESSLRDKWA